MSPLNSSIAIVTGVGREKGIGTAVCRALASAGVDIFFTYWSAYDRSMPFYERNTDDGWPGKLKEQVQNYGVRCASLELDLSKKDAPEKLLDVVEERLGSPAILINNATYSIDAGFKSRNAAILDAHYEVNVRGTLLLTTAFARRIEGRHGGRVIHMVFGQDQSPEPGNLAYVSTKGAVSAFTKSAAVELAPLNITVNAVDPGPTNTGWMTGTLKDELKPRFPMGRIGEPEDAARLICFLAGEDSGWVTGQIIHSDGGFLS
ncbi:SDR family oxidoreductase [Halobacillus halophilus]|uniref:SDR family oxidoreductase n=1 Tax=Halobacillus halophilus TaxID=1570 RepID=UPI00136890ED|nr:SDR family oxidoreductase [Halobacillus halophilus]